MRRTDILVVLLAAATLAAAPGCQRSQRARPGDVDVVVVARAAPDDPVVASAWVRVTGVTSTGAAYDQWIECVHEPEHLEAELEGLPAGSYRLHGKAFAVPPADPATAVADYESPTDPPFDIVPRASRLAVLVLDRAAGSSAAAPASSALVEATTGNHAPRVDGVVAAAPAVDTSDTNEVGVAATASDPDGAGDLASYAWDEVLVAAQPPAAGALTAEGVGPPPAPTALSGSFTSVEAAATRYRPPAGFDGVVLLTVTVRDRKGATSAVTIAIVAKPTSSPGAIAIVALVNVFPEIRGLAATAAQLAPLGSTTLSATAFDANGDPLSYAWSDGGCGGTFGTPAAASTTWRAPAAAGFCTVTVAVEDLDRAVPPTKRGGRVVGTLGLAVSSAAGAFAPEFTLASVAPSAAAAPGGTLWFLAQAVDPRPAPLPPAPISAYAWSDGAGGAFLPLVPGDPSYVAWTAPACGGATAPVAMTVTATATGSAASSSFAFPVTLVCP